MAAINKHAVNSASIIDKLEEVMKFSFIFVSKALILCLKYRLWGEKSSDPINYDHDKSKHIGSFVTKKFAAWNVPFNPPFMRLELQSQNRVNGDYEKTTGPIYLKF